ncbi:hypothetical protein QNO07_17980 [Streptomyces sp. 549]|uniref:hypothetical protein n=1 Tax=Streptomyces sp. 549 TaxID=3049076 RepID=UPI0024C2DD96|nr:hypothetical protein [Streptomyces sp. 549]MDK1475284.1 hypothetical protein [Streptomyces sp. 549]
MRTSARYTGAVAVTAAVLLTSGCGGGSDDDAAKDGKPSAEQSAGEAAAQPGSVQGIWNTTVDGKDVVLTVLGDGATLLRDNTACTGRVTDAAKPSFTLKCPGGSGEERTNGTVDSLEGKNMKVTWNGGDTDSFVKVADTPKDVPTDLGGLEDLVPQG